MAASQRRKKSSSRRSSVPATVSPAEDVVEVPPEATVQAQSKPMEPEEESLDILRANLQYWREKYYNQQDELLEARRLIGLLSKEHGRSY